MSTEENKETQETADNRGGDNRGGRGQGRGRGEGRGRGGRGLAAAA